MRTTVLFAAFGFSCAAAAQAGAATPDFNQYVIEAVTTIAANHAGGGYDAGRWYSHPLDYEKVADIPQGPSAMRTDHSTMCVAAVAETIVEAVHIYAAPGANGPGHQDIFQKLPAASWSRGNLLAILPYVFMRGEVQNVLERGAKDTPHVNGSIAYTRGTGDALSLWHVGEELEFPQLKRGDFVNFNRSGAGGHAAVFWGYIDADNKYTADYSPTVIGFEYFSAQGGANPKRHTPPKPDAGFAFRDAYFGMYAGHGVTPGHGVTHPADRSVIRPGTDIRILNGGRMWMPDYWQTGLAVADITNRLARHNNMRGFDLRVARALDEERSKDIIDFTGEEG